MVTMKDVYKILGCFLVFLSVGMMFANTSYATVPLGWKDVNDDIVNAEFALSEHWFTNNMEYATAKFVRVSGKDKRSYQCSLIIKDIKSGEFYCSSKIMGPNDKYCWITLNADTDWDKSTFDYIAFYRPIKSPLNSI